MTSAMATAQQYFFDPTDINQQQLERILSNCMAPSVDYADIYFQHGKFQAWSLDEQKVNSGTFNINAGVGIRTNAGDKTGFAYTDTFSVEALQKAAISARQIAPNAGNGGAVSLQASSSRSLYCAEDPILSIEDEQKVSYLQQIDAIARALDPKVKEVNVSLAASHEVILIAASDGTFCADVRPLIRLNASVIVEHNGRRESGSMGGGGRILLADYLNVDNAEKFAEEAVRQALLSLDAKPAPAGEMPVVLGSGWPGILLHEAIGHGLEGDFNRKKTSAFSALMGQQVAARGVTVVDDGTLANRRGSLSVDDEGTPTQCTTLIEDGILTGYMQDKLNARLMGQKPTGNGRRQAYNELPMPRMTNTYMQAGKHTQQEMIESIDHGIYAANFGGGQVDITSGKFVFTASEAYLVKNGKIIHPIKGATLIGNGPDVLKQVSMIGNDLSLDSGVGTCGKDGQSVPVGVGQPSLKIDALTVGGNA